VLLDQALGIHENAPLIQLPDGTAATMADDLRRELRTTSDAVQALAHLLPFGADTGAAKVIPAGQLVGPPLRRLQQLCATGVGRAVVAAALEHLHAHVALWSVLHRANNTQLVYNADEADSETREVASTAPWLRRAVPAVLTAVYGLTAIGATAALRDGNGTFHRLAAEVPTLKALHRVAIAGKQTRVDTAFAACVRAVAAFCDDGDGAALVRWHKRDGGGDGDDGTTPTPSNALLLDLGTTGDRAVVALSTLQQLGSGLVVLQALARAEMAARIKAEGPDADADDPSAAAALGGVPVLTLLNQTFHVAVYALRRLDRLRPTPAVATARQAVLTDVVVPATELLQCVLEVHYSDGEFPVQADRFLETFLDLGMLVGRYERACSPSGTVGPCRRADVVPTINT